MTLHTLGNWKAVRKENSHLHTIYSNDVQEICETSMPYGIDEQTRQSIVYQAEANALLISAAPDLLNACRLCVDLIEHVPNPTGLTFSDIEDMPHYKALKSAIKKALVA